MSELAQTRWFVWFLAYLAFAAREDVPTNVVLWAFPVWLVLGAVAHFAWWITGPKKNKTP